jgi:uncharacterized protein YndB with AHSA1/START domain
MTERSAVHDTFTLDRHYDAAPARVFRAFADPAAKALWFAGPPGAHQEDESFDFREGGRETSVTVMEGGDRYGYYATYQDIVPNERIVYSYEMTMNGQRISVSVATIQFRPGAGSGTDFVLTEQGVYLDGLDQPKQRTQGTEELLAQLGESLTKEL